MTMGIGLGVGLVFGLAAIPVSRFWATVLVVAPVLGWLVLLAVTISHGLTANRTEQLALGLLGILLGLVVGQVFDRRDRAPFRRTRD